MKIINFSIATMLYLLVSACESSDDLLDQAFGAGWNTVYQEYCNNVTTPPITPNRYNDPTKNKELNNRYQLGILKAQSEKDLCN